MCCPTLLAACGNHSGEAEHLSGIGLKLFGFIAKLVFAFIPESRSPCPGFPNAGQTLQSQPHWVQVESLIFWISCRWNSGPQARKQSLRFAPRIRDLKDRRLYVFDSRKQYGLLQSLIAGNMSAKLFEENWTEILWLGASVQAGTVAPSALLKRLAAYPRQNTLAKALRDIGKFERTLFTLDWITNPALCRRSNAGLNKGEARNALARAVFFNRLGEIRDCTFENQCYRASGLNLVVAAITLWNTVYLSRAVDQLRAEERIISDELLTHIAPLGWEHISLTGDYVWTPLDSLKGSFRDCARGSQFLRVA